MAAAAPADQTLPSVWNPVTGQYEDPPGAASASSQSASDSSGGQGTPAANDAEYERAVWNPATGQYEDDPNAPPPKPRAKPSALKPVTVTAKKLPVVYDAAEFRARVGRDPSPQELANFQQFKRQGWAHPEGAPAADSSPPSRVGTWIRETVSDPTITGAEKARQIGAVLNPVSSDEDRAAAIAAAQNEIPPEPQYMKAADAQLAKSKSFFGALDVYLTNPRYTFASMLQGLVQGGGVVAAGALGGAAAGPLGAAAGAGGAGYLDKYGETILTTLSANGVDLSDKAAVLKALKDPALMKIANERAAKAGIPAAIINAASTFGRIIPGIHG